MTMDPALRKIRNKEIKAFHQSTLDTLNVSNAIVMSKMAYVPTSLGLSEKHIAFFESEIKTVEDIYIEFGNIDMVAEKVDGYELKSLLKYRANLNYKEEYVTSDSDGKSTRYYVPISELVIVTKPELKNLSTKIENTTVERESKISELLCKPFDITTDPLVKELTIRDYAAIHMKKPISNKLWLNELILNN